MKSSLPSLPPLAWGVVLAVLLVVVALLLPGDPPRSREPGEAADRTAPIAALHAWDRQRAVAWRRGDVRALGDLYVAGSRSGRVDRAMLEAYTDRGLRVTGMRMQLASVEVVRADDARMVLRVTDRLTAAAAVGDGVRRPLPRDGWSRRRVVMVASASGWRVGAVSDQERPEAITAETSGSSNR